ncbi:hypothetical protein A2767_05985 [Candidatus Roizmanbacteria bacterium RIFCSPHIGHO2_01_FULL_35_10]|uniref:Type ISP restriction-modification enzyme LLaBIII C-terminal specificity domain-containing protein n=1 Tax=Candidatus Roizmanbacteria bacterium RIFCSPLOWO2_01_FULL_35_13 TaxID=1802055 RepID=A0A1F7IGA0_9BACT|nr:MAG: hypothetical protein A2767_05985 [Candidatus Roizmanbacteria bacterium RIFCSPHIGHO2_01_FULL_35_10]OGK42375.1 MAG: hypothetical protein A3A74_08040 [Candidatus Roizmanbacteria bacterium RIFCSPLOWO2_01_FULL_35_13]
MKIQKINYLFNKDLFNSFAAHPLQSWKWSEPKKKTEIGTLRMISEYQIFDKWLNDRKGRRLFSEGIKQYCKVITSISKTIAIQKEINKLFPEVEKNL